MLDNTPCCYCCWDGAGLLRLLIYHPILKLAWPFIAVAAGHGRSCLSTLFDFAFQAQKDDMEMRQSSASLLKITQGIRLANDILTSRQLIAMLRSPLKTTTTLWYHGRWNDEHCKVPMLLYAAGIAGGSAYGSSAANTGATVAEIYDPAQPIGSRWSVVADSQIWRMYHSSAFLTSNAEVRAARPSMKSTSWPPFPFSLKTVCVLAQHAALTTRFSSSQHVIWNQYVRGYSDQFQSSS